MSAMPGKPRGVRIGGPVGEYAQHLAHLAHRRPTGCLDDPDRRPGGARITCVQGQPGVLDWTATTLSPWPTTSWRSRAIRSRSCVAARSRTASTRPRSVRTSTADRATSTVSATSSADAPAPGWVASATAISTHVATV